MGTPRDDILSIATGVGGDDGGDFEIGLNTSVIQEKLNTAEDLGKGIIRSISGKVEFTILLVGETGAGKTAMLKLLANVCAGNGPNDYQSFHDQSNEAGGNINSSQTKSAKLYEFANSEGVTIRILDTPGLVDTRGLHQDKAHLASIAETISAEVATVDAVIILANGTVARLGVATDYALTKLSAMFPKSLASNIVFLFTNVTNPWDVNFDNTSLPKELCNNQQFHINNPVALQEKIRKVQNSGPPAYSDPRQDPGASVDKAHSGALDVLARMFNWIDALEPQPTTSIVKLYHQTQDIDKQITAALAAMDEAATKKQELNVIEKELDGTEKVMEQYKNYESIITRKIYGIQPTPNKHNTLCSARKCFSNCHESCSLPFSVRHEKLWRCRAFVRTLLPVTTCNKCGHPRDFHRHLGSIWVEVDDQQVTIDIEAKRKFESAQTDKERQEGLTNLLVNDIARLDRKLHKIAEGISELVRMYANLSLSGSFRGQVQKTILLLEANFEQMRSNSTSDPAVIQSVEKDLGDMKRRFKLLEEVGGEDFSGDTKRRLEPPREAVEWDSVEKDYGIPRRRLGARIRKFFLLETPPPYPSGAPAIS